MRLQKLVLGIGCALGVSGALAADEGSGQPLRNIGSGDDRRFDTLLRREAVLTEEDVQRIIDNADTGSDDGFDFQRPVGGSKSESDVERTRREQRQRMLQGSQQPEQVDDRQTDGRQDVLDRLQQQRQTQQQANEQAGDDSGPQTAGDALTNMSEEQRRLLEERRHNRQTGQEPIGTPDRTGTLTDEQVEQTIDQHNPRVNDEERGAPDFGMSGGDEREVERQRRERQRAQRERQQGERVGGEQDGTGNDLLHQIRQPQGGQFRSNEQAPDSASQSPGEARSDLSEEQRQVLESRLGQPPAASSGMEDRYDPTGPVDGQMLHDVVSNSPLPPPDPRAVVGMLVNHMPALNQGNGPSDNSDDTDAASEDKLLNDLTERVAALGGFPYITANDVSALPPTHSLTGDLMATYRGVMSGAFDDGMAVDGSMQLEVHFDNRYFRGDVILSGGNGTLTIDGGRWSSARDLSANLSGSAYGGTVMGDIGGKFYGPKGQEIGGDWFMMIWGGFEDGESASGTFKVKQ